MKQIFIFLIAIFTFYSTSQGQDKTVFNPEILDIGNCKIISSTLKKSGDYVTQEFIIDVEKAGKYYLAAWVNGAMDLSGEKLTFSVLVNSEKEEHSFQAEKSHPHAVDFGVQKFDLGSGENSIAFKTRKPFCPNVEFIKVSQDERDRQISSEKYDQFINEISNQTVSDNYTELKEASIKKELSQAGLKSSPDPHCNYDYELDVNFKYSYYYTFLLDDDETYTFETSNTTSGTDPVIHLLGKYSQDPNNSWTDDNSGTGINAKLTVDTEWYAGYYYLFIRKAGTSDGTCTLKAYKNGNSTPFFTASSCAVKGSRIECETDNEGTLNWFTADLNNGDSHIWMENTTGNPGKIIKYNDDWTVSSDFNWGNNSRISKNVYKKVRALIVSSHSSYNPEGKCDLYMNCMNASGSITTLFTNLKSNDAIQSAPAHSDYNCISWAGGLTNLNENYQWPPDWANPWEAVSRRGYSDHDLLSFDNFFANRKDNGDTLTRYSGDFVMNFTRMGATSSNACVALWWKSSSGFTHASIKKPANEQPHGYAWESKAGALERVFHPREVLSPQYGDIEEYYQFREGDYSSGEPPAKKSVTVIETANLASDKQVLMEEMIQAYKDKHNFEKLYSSWKRTWDDPELIIHSNPRMFAESNQYKALLEYCLDKGKNVWPLIFNNYIEGEELNMLLIADLTFNDYLWVLDAIKLQQSIKATSAYIIPTQRANYVNHIAALLGELESGLKSIDITNDLALDEYPSVNLYPNPADHTVNIGLISLQQTEVVIMICDLSSKILKSVSSNIKGDHTFSINIEDIPDGIYICKIESENGIRTIKFNVIR